MTGRSGSRTSTASPGYAPGRWAPTLSERPQLVAEDGPVGRAFCRAYTELADRWLTGILSDEPGVAVVAVGGYGRGELCPGSDLDVVLVHSGRKGIQQVAERLWYPIWDAGVGLDHSVRTVKEALAVAGADLKAALGLLDARMVAGDAELAAGLAAGARQQWRKGAKRWLPELADLVEARHAQFGEVAFLLEPELKEGRGGLRDVHALRAAALATEVLDAGNDTLSEPHDVLLGVRVELHRATGKASDRLLLQEQDRVAAVLDYADADALMAAVSAAARTIAWCSDDGWRRVKAPVAAGRSRSVGGERPVGPGLALIDGEVALAATADPAGDPALVLRAAAAAAELGTWLARSALDRLATEGAALPDPWPEAARNALVALLGTGRAAIPVLEALDQRCLLTRILPEWEAVRSRPQRNAYHRFTVDRHLCEAAANAAALTRRVARPDLLLVGALLHDIGKGYPGDHTDVGVEMMARMGARLGFPPADVEVLVSLVRHHLLLPDIATRRDLDDPATVAAVAEAVGDRDTLELLAALTEADGLATGPSAWGPWKAGLVDDLVARTARWLEGHRTPETPALPGPEHRAAMARGLVEVVVEGNRVTVVAPDRPGLFCRVAGTLALHGLDVRTAAAASEESMAVEVFEVEPAFAKAPNWTRVRADVERALMGRLSLEARLADRVRAYAGRSRPSAPGPAEPRVTFDNGASAVATVVEVRAPDSIGVLYRITRALADCDLDVRSAKVSTLGHEVVDAFYVTDAAGAKVVDGEHLAEIEKAVLAELTRARH
ncbi:MAG TPA: [protein-PII] uridylyltransferase [Acidimicrobiales bacterium]|nr:[protein-PII] uridylyltransferase [Acidimicrobiales bacterium]